MNGHVDDFLRALLDVTVRASTDDSLSVVPVWIDTAFNGEFVFPHKLIKKLKLEQQAATDAILADGKTVTLAAYVCLLDWFGEVRMVQVIANDGNVPLLGTELLAQRVLRIDYADKQLTLD